MASNKVSLKLLIDTNEQKVLFAEAGKDFVDFLCILLSLPLGTMIKLLSKHSMVGCLGNLYQSIENLNETYIQPNKSKDILLNPRTPPNFTEVPFLLQDGVPFLLNDTCNYYTCDYRHGRHPYFTDTEGVPCPSCNDRSMSSAISYVAPKMASTSDAGGYVKDVVTYMVMDDLAVSPMSTISSITLLNKFKIKDVGALEEKIVDLGVDEGLKLLEVSLKTKTALTTVFLQKKRDD